MRRSLSIVVALVVAACLTTSAHAASRVQMKKCVASLTSTQSSSATCQQIQRVKRGYRVTAAAIKRNGCSVGMGSFEQTYRSLRVARNAVPRALRYVQKSASRDLIPCGSPWEPGFDPPYLSPPPSPSQTICVDGMPFLSWDAFTGAARLMDAWGGCYRPGIDPEPTRPADPAENPLGWVRNSDGSITRTFEQAEPGGISSQTCVLGGKGMSCSADHGDPAPAP